MKLVAPGGWEVEEIVLDDVPTLRVKQRGYLAGTGRRAGYYTDPAAVARVMGPAFAELTPITTGAPS